MLHVHAEFAIEDLATELRNRSWTGRRKAALVRLGLEPARHAGQVVRGIVRRHHQHIAVLGERHHRPHVLHRVVGHLHGVRYLGEHVGAGVEDGVPVGRCVQHGLHADAASRARLVLDDDGETDFLGQVVGEDTRRHVHVAAGGRGDDDLDHPLGPGLGQR
ncbi:hypothetical protein D3C78_1281410 [compost metagenome]